MHRYFSAILISLLIVVPGAGQAEIYKRINPDGSVEFTDTPQSKDAKPVELVPLPTFTQPAANTTPSLSRQPRLSTKQAIRYTSVTITSPTDDAAIRNNAGNIGVTVTVKPSLQHNHRLVLLMDGNPKTESQSNRFQLTNLDRGTHTLQVRILDQKDTPLLESKLVVFHLLRASIR